MKKKKKNRKLLFQMSVIVLPIFVAMIIAVIYSVYDNTVKSFLEAQNPYMEYLLDRTYENSLSYMEKDELEWYFDFWEKNADAVRKPVSKEEEQALYEYIDNTDTDKIQTWSVEWMENAPDELKVVIAKQRYINILDSLKFESTNKHIERLFLMDVTKGYEGLVLCEYQIAGLSNKIGDRYEGFKMSQHSALKDLLKSKTEKNVFERVRDFPEDGSYYICYKPIWVNGELRAVMGMAYNWQDFQVSVYKTLRRALFVSVGGIILALIVLQIMLYRRAVKPVSRIQSIVREYKNNKDSDEVIARMSEIKERNEFGLLSEDIAELAKEIDYYTKQNMKLAGERERVATELDMARRLQASQLPTQMPAFPDRQDIDVFASMTPAKEVGGDFYDYFLIDDDHLAIVVADVAGKGIPAALFMMMTKMLLTDNAMTGMPPHEVLERTNDTICKHNELEMFVTMWFGVLEISTGRITAANAGHEYPVVRHKDGQFEVLKDTHDFIVGGMEGMAYRQYELELEKGSMLFLYTDGAPEATRADKQMFGMKRLVDALNENPNDTPQVLLERVRARIDEFVGDEPQFDDLTMLGITIL